MSETNHSNPIDTPPPTEGEHADRSDERAAAMAQANAFLEQEIPVLGKLTGLDVDFAVGRRWATDMRTGNFTINPSFFVERDYTPEHAAYATLHELWAHVRDVKREPVMAARQMSFCKKGKAEHLFSNILTDIHGNKLMHHVLPAMESVATDLYDTKLFPLTEEDDTPIDYAAKPLHIQFMYKMIRDEMIPDSDTPVRPEVRAALEELRDYNGAGDVIKYLTDPNSKLSGIERFEQQLAVIYPVYLQLMEQSRKEDTKEERSSKSSDGSSDSQPSEGQPQRESKPSPDSAESGNGTDDVDPFTADYGEYFNTKHPEPMSEEEHDKFKEVIKEAAKDQAKKARTIDPTRELDRQLRDETGFGLHEHDRYKNEVAKQLDAINRMREVFRSVINEHVATRRGLSRRAHTDGAILDPDHLAQTVIDIKSGVHQPEAFKHYESKRGRTEAVGNTDYIFVFDGSDSMAGERAQSAAISGLIMLEALAGVERDVQAAEAEYDLDLELDIRTALYIFGDQSTCLKPLGNGLSDRERLTTQRQIAAASEGGTSDFLALEDIERLPGKAERQRIVIVVTDGESADSARTTAAIRRLRSQDIHVYGVGIESDAATDLYKPHAKRIDTPAALPDVLESFINETI